MSATERTVKYESVVEENKEIAVGDVIFIEKPFEQTGALCMIIQIAGFFYLYEIEDGVCYWFEAIPDLLLPEQQNKFHSIKELISTLNRYYPGSSDASCEQDYWKVVKKIEYKVTL